MERLVEKVIHRMAERKISDLILVSPPYINEDTEYASKLFAGAADKSRKIGKVYSDIAQKYGIIFVDTGPIALVGKDGIHMTHEGHVALADELYRILR
jgi:lysophospholipase L1-like esterase